MVWKNKKDERNPNFREFRSVRYYTNINGKENTYGYDYTLDENGKKVYKEYGDPSIFNLDGDIEERIKEFENMFSNEWRVDRFGLLDSIFPKLSNILEEHMLGLGLPMASEPRVINPTENDSPSEKQELSYDFQKDGDKLYLIIELPGFGKEDLKIKLRDNKLYLVAKNNKKEISTVIDLKYKVNKKSKIDATMQNGILELQFKLAKDEKNDDGLDITIN
ncbi:MAG: Hsp20 family protein [Candidatus Heimdallarchaeum endolithica]|uniref:Hsp20 family protein n=1 Tax=Candidatus Heimdallarchaeum endolithica TaxID=2876572 RepID=A0A9Y1BQ40_9ARCH|nr:MAG: Hsp20 family protein [Candidatus Heimdallarchaeum endolithica]